jgi:hypothetical protein
MNLIMPVMVIGMMAKSMSSMGKPKQAKTGANAQSKKAPTWGR